MEHGSSLAWRRGFVSLRNCSSASENCVDEALYVYTFWFVCSPNSVELSSIKLFENKCVFLGCIAALARFGLLLQTE